MCVDLFVFCMCSHAYICMSWLAHLYWYDKLLENRSDCYSSSDKTIHACMYVCISGGGGGGTCAQCVWVVLCLYIGIKKVVFVLSLYIVRHGKRDNETGIRLKQTINRGIRMTISNFGTRPAMLRVVYPNAVLNWHLFYWNRIGERQSQPRLYLNS